MDIEKTYNLVLNSTLPAVFYEYINHWAARGWTPEKLASRSSLIELQLYFRSGDRVEDATEPAVKKVKHHSAVQWEKNSSYIRATFAQFSNYLSRQAGGGHIADYGMFSKITDDSWVYADYKHMIELFEGCEEILAEIDWGDLGFDSRTGRESTFWMGTRGAHTPCHFDSYGCNLVAQLYGRKRWILFPPSETKYLYPTRVPFEESSVFSQVDVTHPDLMHFPLFSKAVKYEVTLEPGQVLLVPKHWWHYVECESTAISVNTWLDLNCDASDRIEESLASILTAALVQFFQKSSSDFYNPKETPVTPEEGLELLTCSVAQSQQQQVSHHNKPVKAACACCDRRVQLLTPTTTSAQTEPAQTELVSTISNSSSSSSSSLSLSQASQACIDERSIINTVTNPETLTLLRNLISKNGSLK